MKKKFFSIALMAFLSQTAFSAPILHTSDFINTEERTNFVDFESMETTTTFGSMFTQDNVTANQVKGVHTNCSLSCGHIGFSVGSFDQTRLRNTFSSGSFGGGALNTLAIDNIELSGTAPVLEPVTLALLGLGFGFVCRVFTAAPQSLISATIPANKKESARSPRRFRVLQNEQRIMQSGEWPLDPSILFLQRHIQNLYPMPDRNSGHTLNMRQAAYISGGNNIGYRTFQ